MYRLTFTIDTPGFPEDLSNRKAVQFAHRLKEAVEEAVGKHDGDIQHDEVEWIHFELDEGPWTFADEETLADLVCHLDFNQDIMPSEIDAWLDENADDEEQAARVAGEYRHRRRQGLIPLTDYQIRVGLESCVGMARTADVATVRQLGGTLSETAQYAWGHLMGEPEVPAVETVEEHIDMALESRV